MKQRLIAVARKIPDPDLPFLFAIGTCVGVVYAFTKPGLGAPATLRVIGATLMVLSLFDLLPTRWRGFGLLVARGGVVAALILGQLEVGQGPHFFKIGDDWLLIGLGFAVQVLWLELRERARQRVKEARIAAARSARRAELDAWRVQVSDALNAGQSRSRSAQLAAASFGLLAGAVIATALTQRRA